MWSAMVFSESLDRTSSERVDFSRFVKCQLRHTVELNSLLGGAGPVVPAWTLIAQSEQVSRALCACHY